MSLWSSRLGLAFPECDYHHDLRYTSKCNTIHQSNRFARVRTPSPSLSLILQCIAPASFFPMFASVLIKTFYLHAFPSFSRSMLISQLLVYKIFSWESGQLAIATHIDEQLYTSMYSNPIIRFAARSCMPYLRKSHHPLSSSLCSSRQSSWKRS